MTEISERTAHTGRRSQEISARGDEIAIRQITHYNTIKPGRKYLAGMWVKTDIADREGAAWIDFDFTDNGGGVIKRFEAGKKVLGRSKEWVWLFAEGEAPDRSQRLSLNLRVSGRGGAAYFDDACITVIDGDR